MRMFLFVMFLITCPALLQAAEAAPTGTRIAISAFAESEVANDEVVVVYRVEQEGEDVARLRSDVNRIITSVRQRLQKEKGIKLETLNRNMQPLWHYPKNKPRIRSGWRLVQSEQITSNNLDAVPVWLDSIETEGAILSSLQFRVNRESSAQEEASLLQQAVANFRNKAVALARALNARSYRIISLSSSGETPQPVPYRGEMAMLARSADAAPPSLSSGTGQLRISVSGEIEVPFADYLAK